jgi:hypothetical protein
MGDDPIAIALEHYLYWRRLGMSHDAMLLAVDIRPPWRDQLSSDEMVSVLATIYRSLQQRRAA